MPDKPIDERSRYFRLFFGILLKTHCEAQVNINESVAVSSCSDLFSLF